MKGSFHLVLPTADGEILLPFNTTIFEIAVFGLLSDDEHPGSASYRPAACNEPVADAQFELFEGVEGSRRG